MSHSKKRWHASAMKKAGAEISSIASTIGVSSILSMSDTVSLMTSAMKHSARTISGLSAEKYKTAPRPAPTSRNTRRSPWLAVSRNTHMTKDDSDQNATSSTCIRSHGCLNSIRSARKMSNIKPITNPTRTVSKKSRVCPIAERITGPTRVRICYLKIRFKSEPLPFS